MEAQGSLLRLQGNAAGPYREPDEFKPHPPTFLP